MFYGLKLKQTAKTDSKDFKGLTLTKDKSVYVEVDGDLPKYFEKAGVEVTPVDQLPERNESGDTVVLQRVQ